MQDEKAYIFGRIFLFSNKLQNAGNRLFKEITMKQWMLLMAIAQCEGEAPTLSELAQVAGYTRQNVKKLAIHLEEKGFVQFSKDPKDSRALRVTITDDCMSYLVGRDEKENSFIDQLYKGLTKEEIGHLYHAMKKLELNIMELDQERG